MRWRLVSVTACSGVALALAACGGGGTQRLDPERATALAARAERIAVTRSVCVAARAAAALQRDLIEEVNAGHVPEGVQEELLADANELVARLPCPGVARPGAAAVARRLARRVRAASG